MGFAELAAAVMILLAVPAGAIAYASAQLWVQRAAERWAARRQPKD